MSRDCIFCRIVAGAAPADLVYRDDHVTAFRDINPLAPQHVLVVPNRHLESISDLTEADAELARRLLLAVKEVAAREGIADSGYRVISNAGPHGRQQVPHLHIHVLGGHKMRHPMG